MCGHIDTSDLFSVYSQQTGTSIVDKWNDSHVSSEIEQFISSIEQLDTLMIVKVKVTC